MAGTELVLMVTGTDTPYPAPGRADTNHKTRMRGVVRPDDHPGCLRVWALPLEPRRSLSLPVCILHRAKRALPGRNGECSNRMSTQKAPAPICSPWMRPLPSQSQPPREVTQEAGTASRTEESHIQTNPLGNDTEEGHFTVSLGWK